MSRSEKVENIQHAILSLGQEEFDCLRRWFRELDAEEFDRRIKDDIEAGLVDTAAAAALAAHKEGRSCRL